MRATDSRDHDKAVKLGCFMNRPAMRYHGLGTYLDRDYRLQPCIEQLKPTEKRDPDKDELRDLVDRNILGITRYSEPTRKQNGKIQAMTSLANLQRLIRGMTRPASFSSSSAA